VKFWRLTLLQRSLVLIGSSLLGLGISYAINLVLKGELVQGSSMNPLQALLVPFILMMIGSEGHVTDLESRHKPKLVKLWGILSAYFILLSIAFYFQWLPGERMHFVMPLTTILVMLPWVLFQRGRIIRGRTERDEEPSRELVSVVRKIRW